MKLTEDQVRDIVILSAVNLRDHHQRTGQALYNAANEIIGSKVHEVIGSDVDPFYNDARVPKFWEWLTRE